MTERARSISRSPSRCCPTAFCCGRPPRPLRANEPTRVSVRSSRRSLCKLDEQRAIDGTTLSVDVRGTHSRLSASVRYSSWWRLRLEQWSEAQPGSQLSPGRGGDGQGSDPGAAQRQQHPARAVGSRCSSTKSIRRAIWSGRRRSPRNADHRGRLGLIVGGVGFRSGRRTALNADRRFV